MPKYVDRTPNSIQKEFDSYTEEGVRDLARYLQTWMANEHNDRNFVELANKAFKDKTKPATVARMLFGHALDWFAYGN